MLKDFKIDSNFVNDINKNHLSKLLLHTCFIVGWNASEIEEFKIEFEKVSNNENSIDNLWLNLKCKEWIKQCLYINLILRKRW